ncbi:hypothetical protein JCM10908_002509 [Rhodotorula pacifica]|uniref:uncharacterized protein n=1 Tax=Rhodotorula pacifica TaxID=1495444 RepID=UPI0031727F63
MLTSRSTSPKYRATLSSLSTELKTAIASTIARDRLAGVHPWEAIPVRRQSLLSLTLVNSEWQQICEPIAHEEAELLWPSEDGVPSRQPPPRLQRYIKTLAYRRPEPETVGGPMPEPLTLPALRKISIQGGLPVRAPRHAAEICDYLLPYMPSLVSLAVTATPRTPADVKLLAELLLSAGELREIYAQIERQTTSHYESAYTMEMRDLGRRIVSQFVDLNRVLYSLPNLRSAFLFRYEGDVGVGLLPRWDHLERLHLIWLIPEEAGGFRLLIDFLRPVSPTLRKLSVDWNYDTKSCPTSMQKIHFPNLESLKVLCGPSILPWIDGHTPLRYLELDDHAGDFLPALRQFYDSQPTKTIARLRCRWSLYEPGHVKGEVEQWARQRDIDIVP